MHQLHRFGKISLRLLTPRERLIEAYPLAHIGTWDWVIESDTVTWSEEMYTISGRDNALPAPSHAEHSQIYIPSSLNLLSDAVSRALATGDPYNLDLELVFPDGIIRWMHAFGCTKCDENGTIIGLHGTMQDINDRKRKEERQTLTMSVLQILNNFSCEEETIRKILHAIQKSSGIEAVGIR